MPDISYQHCAAQGYIYCLVKSYINDIVQHAQKFNTRYHIKLGVVVHFYNKGKRIKNQSYPCLWLQNWVEASLGYNEILPKKQTKQPSLCIISLCNALSMNCVDHIDAHSLNEGLEPATFQLALRTTKGLLL